MDYQHIRVETKEHYALLTIDRPKALNALSSVVLSELITAISEIELDDAVRVVIITGAGEKSFVAGADIAEMQDLGPHHAEALAELGGTLAASIENAATPYIAAVNGFALGGGLELALACDFIYAADTAKLGLPEVTLGVIPGFGGTQRLPRRVGVAKAKEMIFTGARIGAEEALRIGLVDAVYPLAELLEAAGKTAARIAANGPLAVAQAKKLVHVGQSMSLESAAMLEQRTFAGLFDTEDQKEGMRAFLDKRKADFRGV
ncbi:enoyl-CoA hydratase/isomerase family protein [Haliangium ochraceum]|uniref:Enoyl-CoA hydratase/isomerase n=1 Tax=Haliangium ochraceum (strain DSM 14365 / JCM 11303 / SMP-2) TaxID=502025 RepID=D0LYC9_HALO1|nr:enoyl-CoA hydratase-related protein [Haliangium ochraceum]ACY16279.1 Enoyl-CoA hydratase/isomerase [Haliangium ochraceum DSM 14365]